MFKRTHLFSLCLILSALAAPALLAEAAAETADLPPNLQELDRRMAELTTLQARFAQEKHTALLKRPLLSEGDVLFKEGLVLWRTETPRPSKMLMAGGEIRLYDPDAARLEIFRVEEKLSRMAASPVPSLALLAENFTIEEKATSEDGDVVLHLVPRTDALREQLEDAEIAIDRERAYVRSIEIRSAGGDRTVIRFTDAAINEELSDEALVLDVPPDTEIVEPNRQAS